MNTERFDTFADKPRLNPLPTGTPTTCICGLASSSFRFAVFPKQYITFNPMQYVVMRHKKDDMDLIAEETDTDTGSVKPLSFEQYQKLIAQLGRTSALRNNI